MYNIDNIVRQQNNCSVTLLESSREGRRSAKRHALNCTDLVHVYRQSFPPLTQSTSPQTLLSVNFSEACTIISCSQIRTKYEMEKQLRFCSSFYDAHKLPLVCPDVKPLKFLRIKCCYCQLVKHHRALQKA